MFCIAICDDNPDFIDVEKRYIDEYLSSINCDYKCWSYLSGSELIQAVNTGLAFNLILLDYKMVSPNGIETARQIRLANPHTSIAFVSAYIEASIECFKIGVIRYIIKNTPTFKNDLKECLSLTLAKNEETVICLPNKLGKQSIEIKLSNLLYIENSGRKVAIHLNKKKEPIIYNTTVSKLTPLLKNYGLIMCHQSIIVNPIHVENYKRYSLVLSNGATLTIAQPQYDSFVLQYNRWRLRSL